MENGDAILLGTKIQDLDLSRSAVHFLELNHLNSLGDLIRVPMEHWFEFTGFSQHLLNELMNYFEKFKLLNLVVD